MAAAEKRVTLHLPRIQGGREPKDKHLLTSNAEMEKKETMWDPQVDLKYVFLCFADFVVVVVVVKKVSVQ